MNRSFSQFRATREGEGLISRGLKRTRLGSVTRLMGLYPERGGPYKQDFTVYIYTCTYILSARLFGCTGDGEVYIWDMNTRSCVHKFRDDGCLTGTSLAVSRDGQYVACGWVEHSTWITGMRTAAFSQLFSDFFCNGFSSGFLGFEISCKLGGQFANCLSLQTTRPRIHLSGNISTLQCTTLLEYTTTPFYTTLHYVDYFTLHIVLHSNVLHYTLVCVR